MHPPNLYLQDFALFQAINKFPHWLQENQIGKIIYGASISSNNLKLQDLKQNFHNWLAGLSLVHVVHLCYLHLQDFTRYLEIDFYE